jgi:hypothetical protein
LVWWSGLIEIALGLFQLFELRAAIPALVVDCWRNRSHPLPGSNPSLLLNFKDIYLGQIGVLTEGISNFVLEWFGLVVGIN